MVEGHHALSVAVAWSSLPKMNTEASTRITLVALVDSEAASVTIASWYQVNGRRSCRKNSRTHLFHLKVSSGTSTHSVTTVIKTNTTKDEAASLNGGYSMAKKVQFYIGDRVLAIRADRSIVEGIVKRVAERERGGIDNRYLEIEPETDGVTGKCFWIHEVDLMKIRIDNPEVDNG
jgi:hypothetical protein